jgi:hypothetical protein
MVYLYINADAAKYWGFFYAFTVLRLLGKACDNPVGFKAGAFFAAKNPHIKSHSNLKPGKLRLPDGTKGLRTSISLWVFLLSQRIFIKPRARFT